jgi:type I restriction enzyme S subunit
MMEKLKNIPSLRFSEFQGEWGNTKLGEVCDIIGGGTPETNNDEYWNGDINWFTPTEIKSNYVSKSIRKISTLGLQKSSAKILPIGTILLTTRATIGEASIALEECTTNQGFQSLITKNGYNNVFIFNWIRENKYELTSRANGSTFPEINKSEIEKIPIQIPSQQEQTKIASFLTAVDDKLQALKQKKTLLEQYKKGVMQKIFSQELRFKDDNGNDYPDWEETKVKDIFIVTRGNVLSMTLVSNEQDENNLFPVYSSQTKNNGLSGYYDKFLFEDCITWTTDGAGAGDVNFRKGKFYCTNVCGVLKSDKGYANTFVAEILNSVSRKYVSYVGNPKLMNNVMSEIQISIPKSIEEQTKIANFLSAIDEKTYHCQAQIEKTEVWKKGLLQQMFV